MLKTKAIVKTFYKPLRRVLFKFGVMLGKEHLFMVLVFKIFEKNLLISYKSYNAISVYSI